MSEHTREPWAADEFSSEEEGCAVIAVDPEIGLRTPTRGLVAWCGTIAGAAFNSSETAEANARRIVACVNVLQGVPTEQLEEAARLGITDISSGNLFSSRLKLEQQRDKLLVAARKAVKDFRIESGPLVDAIAEIEAAK